MAEIVLLGDPSARGLFVQELLLRLLEEQFEVVDEHEDCSTINERSGLSFEQYLRDIPPVDLSLPPLHEDWVKENRRDMRMKKQARGYPSNFNVRRRSVNRGK